MGFLLSVFSFLFSVLWTVSLCLRLFAFVIVLSVLFQIKVSDNYLVSSNSISGSKDSLFSILILFIKHHLTAKGLMVYNTIN